MLNKLSYVVPTLPDCVVRSKILIADERFRERNSLFSILQEAGCTQLYPVVTESDVLKHLRNGYRFPEQQMDVLVLSSTLPDVDVVRLCRQILISDFSSIPVLVLSESGIQGKNSNIDSFLQAGALDVLYHPLRDVEVIPRINLIVRLGHQAKKSNQVEQELRDKLAQQRQLTLRKEQALHYDNLTQLASRQHFTTELKRFLGASRNLYRYGALLYLDINNFKVTNDIWGHDKGNEVLKEVASVLVRNLDEKHLVARLGSDEFAILLSNVNRETALNVAKGLSVAVDRMVVGDGPSQITTTVSIGIVEIHPAMIATKVNEVLTCAHQACRIAKSRVGQPVNLYDDDDPELKKLREVVQAVSVVRRGLHENWFRLFLQPITRAADRTLAHFEVLLRLMDDQGRSYSPDLFIPAAEQAGLIISVDYWVIENSFDLLEKLSVIDDTIGISINLSAAGMQEEDIYDLIEDRLSATLIDPQRVTFELTETAAIQDVKKIRNNISHLRGLGCRFALDDFGSGYCSFNYVKNFPADFLKIDGMFIRNIVDDHLDQITVSSMVKIAHSLGKKVIAEFVETEEIIDCLTEMQVDYLQGYCLGKPEPAERVLQQLSGDNGQHPPLAGFEPLLHSI